MWPFSKSAPGGNGTADPAQYGKVVAGWGLHNALSQHFELTGRHIDQKTGGQGDDPVGKLPWIGDTNVYNQEGGGADKFLKVGVAALGLGAGALGLLRLWEGPSQVVQSETTSVTKESSETRTRMEPFIIDGQIDLEVEGDGDGGIGQ